RNQFPVHARRGRGARHHQRAGNGKCLSHPLGRFDRAGVPGIRLLRPLPAWPAPKQPHMRTGRFSLRSPRNGFRGGTAMLPLFDMLANAQNGKGMEALARQYNLSMQQTQAAVEALLPAFSQALKQNTSDPYGVGAFLTAMASGQHAKYFDNPSNAFSPAGLAEGNGILGHLFGSKELSRAVADQAAAVSGVSQEVLKQM